MARDRSKHDLTVTFTGLSKPQKLAIIDMLACWKYLSGVGSSRMVSFYVDGDGDFHPVIKVDGEDPKSYGTSEQVIARWGKPGHQGSYVIDYDEIAGLLQREEQAAWALGAAGNPVPHRYRTLIAAPGGGCSFMGDHRFCLRPESDPVHNYPTGELTTKMETPKDCASADPTPAIESWTDKERTACRREWGRRVCSAIDEDVEDGLPPSKSNAEYEAGLQLVRELSALRRAGKGPVLLLLGGLVSETISKYRKKVPGSS